MMTALRAWEEVERDEEATAAMERAAVEQPHALCRFSQKAQVRRAFHIRFKVAVDTLAVKHDLDVAVKRAGDLHTISGSGSVAQVKAFFDDLDQLPLRSRRR